VCFDEPTGNSMSKGLGKNTRYKSKVAGKEDKRRSLTGIPERRARRNRQRVAEGKEPITSLTGFPERRRERNRAKQNAYRGGGSTEVGKQAQSYKEYVKRTFGGGKT
jgi:hypothetical protein